MPCWIESTWEKVCLLRTHTGFILFYFILSPKQYSKIIISIALSLYIGCLKSSRDDLNYLRVVHIICKYFTILYSTGMSTDLDVGVWSWSESPMDTKGQLY